MPYKSYIESTWFFFEQIHWFSIFNSFMMVIFLVGLVSMILMRTLRKDYARYSKEDDLDDMVRFHIFFLFNGHIHILVLNCKPIIDVCLSVY